MFKKNETVRQPDNMENKTKGDDPGFRRVNQAKSFEDAAAQSRPSSSGQNSRTDPTSQGPRAVIGASVVIKGEVHGDEDVSIYGKVDGAIVLPENHLLIGNTGKIDANVQVKSVDVEGALKGEVSASERITIRKSGNVNGNISAPRVMLEDGCRFEGNIQMIDKQKADTATAEKAATAAKVEKAAETK